MKKILIVFGTRPEAIKMAPLVHEFEKYPELFETKVCVTAQHREMLDQVLHFFGISPHFDLNVMKPNQDLYSLTANILTEFRSVLDDFRPDFVFVHGDTTTSMVASLAAFYWGAKVCHIEAGLRTYNKRSPFPEELNRQITGRLADYHFSPTVKSKDNLMMENIERSSILVTGNTVIDALMDAVERVKKFSNHEIEQLQTMLDPTKRVILVTGHRRENHGQGFLNICQALKKLAESHPECQIFYPVHLNPKVKEPVYRILSGVDNIKLIDPLSYPAFIWLMKASYFIITDSGGIQEEAPSLGKPVLVMRDTTERPEAVEAGTVILVGTDPGKILDESKKLLLDSVYYESMSSLNNPYGDGKACERIVKHLMILP